MRWGGRCWIAGTGPGNDKWGEIYQHFVIPGLVPGIQLDKMAAMLSRTYYVYILASKRNGTLYIGVTNNLVRRVYEHRNKLIAGFTKKYGVHLLVWYDSTNDIREAIQKEKSLKKYPRKWKIALIEKENPNWDDLWEEINTA